MEARERYRRGMAASVELGRQQNEEVIQRLQEENEQIKEESKQKDERIRYLEAQLAQANKHD